MNSQSRQFYNHFFIFFFFYEDSSYKLYTKLTINIYNEHIHINMSLIFIKIYSDITLLLIIINLIKSDSYGNGTP